MAQGEPEYLKTHVALTMDLPAQVLNWEWINHDLNLHSYWATIIWKRQNNSLILLMKLNLLGCSPCCLFIIHEVMKNIVIFIIIIMNGWGAKKHGRIGSMWGRELWQQNMGHSMVTDVTFGEHFLISFLSIGSIMKPVQNWSWCFDKGTFTELIGSGSKRNMCNFLKRYM